MKEKAKQCDQCKFFTTEPNQHLCRAANFPRFYKPSVHCADWGWKRVCEDFKPKDGK